MTKRKKSFDPDNPPPLTREFSLGMRPFHEVLPQFKVEDEHASEQRRRGRPLSADPLVNISIRVRSSILPQLRAKRGYQTQITRLVENFARNQAPPKTVKKKG